MRSSSETRRSARTALSGNWGNAVVVTLITLLIASAIGFLTSFILSILQFSTGFGSLFRHSYFAYGTEIALPALISISGILVVFAVVYIGIALCAQLVQSNLTAGMANYHLNLASGRRSDISDLFAQFKRGFMKPFGIFWLIYIKIVLWILAGYAPAFVLMFVAGFSFSYELPALGGVCIFFAILLVILGLILGIVAEVRYSMAFFVLADNPGIGVRESVRRSKELMHGHKVDYVILNLSFIGWWILSLFTCGIGTLFLTPYINTSVAVFYCDLIARPVVGDTAWYNMMQSGAYNPNGYNPNGYNTNTYNPGAYNQTPYRNYDPDITAEQDIVKEPAVESTPEFCEVDISKIGSAENIPEDIPENSENASDGDNTTQNN